MIIFNDPIDPDKTIVQYKNHYIFDKTLNIIYTKTEHSNCILAIGVGLVDRLFDLETNEVIGRFVPEEGE